ncbi:MAG TPA: efflux RND transporter permease subunit [Candidatus Dormibacteraeota bacterium]|jgi:Cu/Ag efflux pump CusA|nr:efflux RND transporter permease subunit [Candidatus Dormibacteraeota bacterium]
MIGEIVGLVLKFRILVIGAAVAVMALGSVQLRNAPVDLFPEFAPPQVEIQAEALGLSASEVEQLITVPLEQDLLNGVAWLDQIRSDSAPGLSTIDLIFQPGTDVFKARQFVQERMTQAHALPAVGNPPVMVQPLSSTSRVMMVGLSAKDLSLVDMSVLARWKVRPKLMGVPGVANVSIWGQRDRQLQVQVDPDRLRDYGITLSQVINTAGNALWVSPLTFVEASTPGTGGFIDSSSQRMAIQHVLPITNAANLASVTIEDTSGRTMRLGDVANVVEDHQPLIGDASVSGGPGLMLVIQKFPEASTQQVTRGIEQALDALRPGLSGIRVDSQVYQAESFIDSALHTLGGWALLALGLLVLVFLVLLPWRAALIAGVSVVASLLVAAYVLYLTGTTFNIMVLAGLAVAVAVVVDDAVVDPSSILRRLRTRGAADRASAVIEGSRATRGPLVYATLIALIAPLPLVFLSGVGGSFTRPAVLGYTVAVLASLLVALTLTPALSHMLLRDAQRAQPRWHTAIARGATVLFDRTAARAIARPAVAYGALALCAATAFALVPQLDGRSLLPAPQDRNVLVHVSAAPGTSLTEMARLTAIAARELRAVPGVRDVGTHVGRAVLADQAVDVSAGEMWVSLRDDAAYDGTVARISTVLHGYPGVRTSLDSYGRDRVHQVQTGSDAALTVRVYGIDLATLHTTAQHVGDTIAHVDGVTATSVQSLADEPTMEVEVNLATAQKYGLNPGDVRRATATYFSGLLVGNLYEEQKIFDVVVWGSPSTRSTPATLADLRIDAPVGGQVRLGDVAAVRIKPAPTMITHDATSRSVDVSAQVNGRSIAAVMDDVKARVGALAMPLEYHAEVLSARADQQNENARTIGIGIGIAVVVLLLLQAAFGSWRLAGIVFGLLPLSVAGSVLASFAAGGLMSAGALAGLFTVAALTARHAVLLVRTYQGYESAKGGPLGLELLLRATRERAAAILLTFVATVAVLLPMVVIGNRSGTEVLHPFAIAVLGGLASSALLTVIALPSLYLRLAPIRTTASEEGL